jgi:hypothetical protein
MFLRELFALITERRRQSDEPSREAGAQITGRLQESLDRELVLPRQPRSKHLYQCCGANERFHLSGRYNLVTHHQPNERPLSTTDANHS